jgi:serine/threonine protein kinase
MPEVRGEASVPERHVDEDAIVRFVSGSAGAAEAAEIRRHVDVCDECRELLAAAARDPSGARIVLDSEVEVGDLIDERFRIEREIGRGGMGIVYAARDIVRDEPIALKVLHADTADDEERVARFLRESRVLAGLRSPHSVRVYDVGRLRSGAPYMVMELLVGEDLDAIASSGPIDPHRAAALIEQASRGIGDAHRLGIVHRDINLQNLFVVRENGAEHVKVLDFGLAKPGKAIAPETALTSAESLMGTPRFMAPEQLVSARDVDARADVWALGVCLYRLSTGHFPFDARNVATLTARILGTHPRRPRSWNPAIPSAVEQVTLRCLARAAAERYPNADALADALTEARADRPRKRPLLVWVGALALGATAVGAVAAQMRTRDANPVAPTATPHPSSEVSSAPIPSATPTPPTEHSGAGPSVSTRAATPHVRPSSSVRTKSMKPTSPTVSAPAPSSTERFYEKM